MTNASILQTSITNFYAEVLLQQNTLAEQSRKGLDRRPLEHIVKLIQGKNAAFVFAKRDFNYIPNEYVELARAVSESDRVAVQNDLILHDKQWTCLQLAEYDYSRRVIVIHGTESKSQFWRLATYVNDLARRVGHQEWILLKSSDDNAFWLHVRDYDENILGKAHVIPADGYSCFTAGGLDLLIFDFFSRNRLDFSEGLYDVERYQKLVASRASDAEKPVWVGHII